MLLLWCLIILTVLAVSLPLFFDPLRFVLGDDEKPRDQKTVKFTFPTGEIVTNYTYALDESRFTKLTFQESLSSPPQSMGMDITTYAYYMDELLVNQARLFRYANHLVVVIDPYIFVREDTGYGPAWGTTRFLNDVGTANYLRTFQRPGDRDFEVPGWLSPQPGWDSPDMYHFDHLEDDGTKLFLASVAHGHHYPQYLVYHQFDPSDWRLDVDSTHEANKVSLPPNP